MSPFRQDSALPLVPWSTWDLAAAQATQVYCWYWLKNSRQRQTNVYRNRLGRLSGRRRWSRGHAVNTSVTYSAGVGNRRRRVLNLGALCIRSFVRVWHRHSTFGYRLMQFRFIKLAMKRRSLRRQTLAAAAAALAASATRLCNGHERGELRRTECAWLTT